MKVSVTFTTNNDNLHATWTLYDKHLHEQMVWHYSLQTDPLPNKWTPLPDRSLHLNNQESHGLFIIIIQSSEAINSTNAQL